MTSSDEQHSQDDEVFTQIQPQITTVTNTKAKFPYLKKAEEHLAVQRETKARTPLLTVLPDDHMGDFYHLDDAKEIWLAIKARFGGNEESKKMKKSFLKQEFEEFKITEAEVTLVLKTKGGLEVLSHSIMLQQKEDWVSSFDTCKNKLKSLEFDVKGYAPKPSSLANAAFISTASTNNNNDTSSNHSPSYSTSYSGNREASSSHGSVVDDCTTVHKRVTVAMEFRAKASPRQLKVEQRSDGIFISQDKYVAEILRKFDLDIVKTATNTL
ncbi:hypothetical protein Tco_0089792 [Tanacetum coccineum]